MTSRILIILITAALPGSALADPGHFADQGGGHSHWGFYLLLAIALSGFGLWARAHLNRR